MTATTTVGRNGDLNESEVSGGTQESDRSLSHDTVFHILQNERRRLVLEYLQGRDDPVRMCDVAEQVAAWEHDTTVEQLTSKQRQRVYIPLYQNHLTKLDEEGVIDYNQSRGIVERNAVADQFDPYLDASGPDAADAAAVGAAEPTEQDGMAASDRWGKYYLGVSVFGTLFVAAKSLGVAALGAFSGVLVSAIVLLAFSLVTLFQLSAPLWQP
jgi:hypothetical protein